MTPDRLVEIEHLHAREPAPQWATELLEEVRRLHGRADTSTPKLCPGCHREVEGDDASLTRHMQTHNRGHVPRVHVEMSDLTPVEDWPPIEREDV